MPKWRNIPPLSFLLLSLPLVALLTGCGLFAASDEPEGPIAIRTVYPTFTPTPLPTTIPVESTPVPQDVASPVLDEVAAQSAPKAVINGPVVNARTGPGTTFDIIDEVGRGDEFEIIGVSPDRGWWQICCVGGQEAWVTSEFVDTIGMVDSVPVIGGTAQAQATPEAPAASEAPAAPVTPTAVVPTESFLLETQEQFPESAAVRIFLYVYTGNSALEGYSLRVTKDGNEMPVEGSSFGGQPALTWPFQDPRQRFQNFKVEYPDTPPQGVWQVQLVNAEGVPVGPTATFTLSANDPQQELYVRYARQ